MALTSLGRLKSRKLLTLYGKVMSELRRRGIVRSGNNPVADLAELLVSKAFKLTLEGRSTARGDQAHHHAAPSAPFAM